MKAMLVLDSGKQQGRTTQLAEGVYLVGRSKSCQIRPKNRSVSRKHCAIINRGKRLQIQDIGSKTGTFINGQPLASGSPVELADGDELRVGRTRFHFVIERSAMHSRVPERALAASAAVHVETPKSASSTSGELAFDSPLEAEAEVGEIADPTAADILRLLDDEEEHPAVAGDREFRLDRVDPSAHVDLEESDSDVDFLAPASGESLNQSDPVPAYQLQQDWDVAGVRKWVAGGTPAPAKPKPTLGSAKPSPKFKSAAAPSGGSFFDRLDGDALRPIGMAVAVLIFLAWIAWNVWQLWSFKG